MELALVRSGVNPVAPKLSGHFSDMGRVLFRVIGIHQNIILVHDYRDVNHIGEDIIYEPLETSRGIGEPLGYH